MTKESPENKEAIDVMVDNHKNTGIIESADVKASEILAVVPELADKIDLKKDIAGSIALQKSTLDKYPVLRDKIAEFEKV